MNIFRSILMAGVAAGLVAAAGTANAAGGNVTSGNSKVDVSLSGHVNKAFYYVDDGKHEGSYIVDNDISSTRFRFKGKTNAPGDFSVGFNWEFQVVDNSTANITQFTDNQDVGAGIGQRQASIIFASKSLGKVTLGHGSTAGDGTYEADLSGTSIIAMASPRKLATAMEFRPTTASGTSLNTTGLAADGATQIGDVMADPDGLGRQDRIRYDSPNIMGFVLSADIMTGGSNDIALRYSRDYGAFKVKAAGAYSNRQSVSATEEDLLDGSLSVLLSNGLSVTLAGSAREFDPTSTGNTGATTINSAGTAVTVDGRTATSFYVKGGYKAKLLALGETAVSLDWNQFNDQAADNQEAESWGIGLVQQLSDYGTEVYATYRNYSLDIDAGTLGTSGANGYLTSSTGIEDVDIFIIGSRIKF